MNTIHAGQILGVVAPRSSGAAFDATPNPYLYPLFFALALIAVGLSLMALGSRCRRSRRKPEREDGSLDLGKGD